MVFCPFSLSDRRISNCGACKIDDRSMIVKIGEDSIMCDYPHPDKAWFWKRQLDPNYPKKLKVK